MIGQGHEGEKTAAALARAAARLGGRGPGEKRLPALLLFTDPSRTPDPAAAAALLPRGSGVVFRAFGSADAVETGRALRRVCDARGLALLVGADARLAAATGADGVHLPERACGELPFLRARRPEWLFTAAAHSRKAAVTAAALGADAVVVSPVFPSRSPSAGRPLGPARFAAIVHATDAPVYALGGVNLRTVMRLRGSGAVGVAAVEALS